MSTPTTIAKYLPRSNSAIKRIVSSGDDGTTFVDEVIEKSAYTPVVFSADPGTALVEQEKYHESVVRICDDLMKAFPKPLNTESEKIQYGAFYGLLYRKIEDEKMPLDRLRDSVNYLIKTQQKYKSFNIADILNYDKKIVLAKNKGALSRKLGRKLIDSELAMTYEIMDGRVVRLIGLSDDISDSPEYSHKVLAVWDEDGHGWKFIGTVDDPSIEDRKKKFKEFLFPFSNYPPRFNGPYSVEIVKSFYEYWSTVMVPGDTLRYETKMHFDVESWLGTWAEKYNQ